MKKEYNGLSVLEVRDRIIAREEEYLNTDYGALSFEEKCAYAVEYTSTVHFTIDSDPQKRAQMLEELRPELLRRAERDDPFALYVLGCRYTDLSDISTDTEHEYLLRSMELGYIPAALKLLDIFHSVDKGNDEALDTVDWLRDRITEGSPEKQRFLFYLLTENRDGCKEAAIRLASEGDTEAISALRFCQAEGECIDFYDTALFLAYDHFYRKGTKHLAELIGRRLIRSNGCEFDFERIKEIYIDLMMGKEHDRARLLDLAKVKNDDLDGAETFCRRLISEGKGDGYWRLILVALLSGDRERLLSVLDEMNTPELALNIDRAYIGLCLSLKKEQAPLE